MPTKGYLITDKSGEMKKSLLTCKKRVLDLRGPKKNRCHFQKPGRFKNKTFALSKTAKVGGLKPSRSQRPQRLLQILVADTFWHHVAQALLLVFLVVGEVALKPDYLRVSFKSQDMRTNTI